MRINQVKRIHNKPMKSPSPDFVSRNGIKDTSLDMRDLKKYLEKKDQAMRSSEFQQSSSAIIGSPEVEYLRKQLQQLEQKNQQLEAEKQRSFTIMEENSRLNNELSRMRDLLKSQSSSVRNLSPKNLSKKSDDSGVVKDYREKLIQLMEENKRIGQKFLEKNEECKSLETQLNKQKKENSFPSTFIRKQQKPQAEYQVNLTQQVQKMFNAFQFELQKRLREVEDRITVLQNIQFGLERKLQQQPKERKTQIYTPDKKSFHTPSRDTYYKDPPLDQSHQRSKGDVSGTIIDSHFSGGGKTDDRIREEKYQLQRENAELQNQLNIMKSKNIMLEEQLKSTQEKISNESFLKSKIQYLQSELEKKVDNNDQLEGRVSQLQSELGQSKDRLQRSNYLLENQMNTYKRALQQEKQKSQHYENSLKEMIEKSGKLERQAAEIRQTIKRKENIEAYYESLLQKTKDQYESALKQKDAEIRYQIRSLFDSLSVIKASLTQTSIQDFFKETQHLLTQNSSLTFQIKQFQQSHQKIINELKIKLVTQEQQIIQLEKDKQLLQKQIETINVQKDKLKQAMLEFEKIGVVGGLTPRHKFEEKSDGRSCRLKGCLKDTIEKIDNLEQKISKILQQ